MSNDEGNFTYQFKVIFQPKFMKNACDLMKACDMDIVKAGYEQILRFISKREVTISEIKEHLKKAFASEEISLLSVEGGKVEK